jgi:beta-glucosidase
MADSDHYEDLDPIASPFETVDSNITPGTEYSPPLSPSQKSSSLNDSRSTAKAKLAQLDLEEKVSLLTAADFWRTQAIPSKGVAAIKTSDGPNGARGGIFVGGTKAALFPCGISLAATWNKSLLYQVGQHLADEVKARSANVLLAPTVCMHRHPLGGRNFESFSEDPLLTGKLAAQYIRGLQSKGVAATIKHFVANEQETHRLTIDSVMMERPLREIYLKPFEIAVREANPWAVMSSYNRINGVHADMNLHTLKTILRGEWGYDG